LTEDISRAVLTAPDAPENYIFEGENLHALHVLAHTHASKVDLIYIDPPYNTGSEDFIYNDKFVDPEDSYRHSKWLSFMERRLRIARDLLSPMGAIIIAIDDNEYARLTMLCDQVFSETNYLGTFVWDGGRKNDSHFISTGHDYMLVYSRNKRLLEDSHVRYKVRKQGLEEIYRQVGKLTRKHGKDYSAMSSGLKKWYSELAADHPSKANKHYCWVDERGAYFAADISWPGGGGPTYKVVHPLTRRACKSPSRGWVFASTTRMQEMIEENRIHFGKDETSVPCVKRYLQDTESEVIKSVFYKDRRAASKDLRALLGRKAFDYPKDVPVLARIFSSIVGENKKALLLDFFAGSGTTAQAVLEMNKADGGTRSFILVTDNENSIAEEICYPRVAAVINGYDKHDGKGKTTPVPGIPANLRYYRVELVDKLDESGEAKPADDLRVDLAAALDDTIKFAENVQQEVSSGPSWRILTNDDHYVGIVHKQRALTQFKKALAKLDNSRQATVYVFSYGADDYSSDFTDSTREVTLHSLPEGFLATHALLSEVPR
jgi:hypothetical protein